MRKVFICLRHSLRTCSLKPSLIWAATWRFCSNIWRRTRKLNLEVLLKHLERELNLEVLLKHLERESELNLEVLLKHLERESKLNLEVLLKHLESESGS